MINATEITTCELSFDELNAVCGGNGFHTLNSVLAGISATVNVGASAVMAGSFLATVGAATVVQLETQPKQEKQ